MSGPFKLGRTSQTIGLSSDINKTAKKATKATKKLSKKLKKAAKKANKKITKAIKQHAKEQAKKAKAKERVLDKRRRQVDRLAQKADKLNEIVSNTVNEYEQHGYEIVNKDYLTKTKQRIDTIKVKANPTEKDIELLKDWSKANTYDYIKVVMPIRQKSKGGIAVVDDEEISFKDIRLARRKQVTDPSKLSSKQQQIISNYTRAMVDYENMQAPDLSTPEAIQKFQKQFNVTRSVAIGGQSTLINDLSYTYDALQLGRDFVETLQKIMSNPTAFVQIEQWYTTTSDGADVKDQIDKARGKQWYSNYLSFSTIIRQAIASLPNMDKVTNKLLSELSIKAEAESDEEQGL